MARLVRPVVTVLAGLVVVLAVGAGIAWRAGGGAWENIGSPSMGTVAPVGSLVLTRPVPAGEVRVGDVVTYQPPDLRARHTTTHRVVARTGAGPATTWRTRGDINGADDPWVLHPADLRGKAVAIVPGGGWLLRAVPLLILVMGAVWLVTRYWVPERWRIPVRVLGASSTVSVVSVILKPWVGAVPLARTADAAGAHLTFVSTGVLPSRLVAASGGELDLSSGQVGTLNTVPPPGAKGAQVTAGTHLSWWLWLLMTAIWLLPMLVGLAAEARRLRARGGDGPDHGQPSGTAGEAPTEPVATTARRRPVTTGAAVGATALLLLAPTTTAGAFTARITNTADSAASAPYFKCATATPAPGSITAIWPLDDDPIKDGALARDVNTSSRSGVYTGPTSRSVNNHPCPRDISTASAFLNPSSTTGAYVAANANATAVAAPTTFSMVLWFQTTSATTDGGRMIGWGASRTGTTTNQYDRHVYMTDAGNLVFGVYPNKAVRTITTPGTYMDGQWHQVVATLSSAGMLLYVDGRLVARDTSTTSAESYNGFPRVGYDNLAGWPGRPTDDGWTGNVAWAGFYSVALSQDQISAMYTAGL